MALLDRAVHAAQGVYRVVSALMGWSNARGGYVVPGSPRKAMKAVRATANSPATDIIDKLPGMRALSRDGYMNSPLATSILRRSKILGIGSGLQYQSVIDHEYLGIAPRDARKKSREFEREFDLWANSPHADFAGVHWFGDMQALGYFNMLLSGDFFFMPVWRTPSDPSFPYELAIKLIDADLVRDPDNTTGKDVQGGVEYKDGRVYRYWVWDGYPDECWTVDRRTLTATPVTKFDETGRQQIFHVHDPERINQRRGVPRLAPVAEQLKQLTRLTDAELMSALVSAFFTAFVRDQSGMGAMLGPALTPEEVVTGGGRYDPTLPEVGPRNQEDGNDLEMGYGSIVQLDANKDVTIAERHKVDSDFGEFFDTLATGVGAVGGTPIEQANLRYTTSYTAARAAANDVWRHRAVDRTLIARQMNIPIQLEWMTEAILKQRISAPGFFDDYADKMAWSRSSWVGMGQGALDPLREGKAIESRLKSFVTNHETESLALHGMRWDEMMAKRAQEKEYLEELGLESAAVEDPENDREEETSEENSTDDTVKKRPRGRPRGS